MKIQLAALGALLLASASASAQITCQTIGTQRYCNSPNGNSTSQQIGNTTYTNRSDGVTSTTQRIGSTLYQNRSDGVTSTTQRIGNT